MPQQPLGRMEPVNIREVWGNESSEFTPWLAETENLRLLGDTLGLELEAVEREKGVGRFSADLLCRDTTSGRYVLVENQLEASDHSHLGQVLTYCAGLDGAGQEVRTAVWIAANFTEEHRAALDWLNEIGGDRFQFFGLELELWRIGASAVAPKFNVVSRPNAWSRDVGESVTAGAMTEQRQRQLAYWTAFHAHLKRRSKLLKPQKPQAQSWMTLALGRSGFHLSAVASDYDLAAQSYGDGEQIRACVNIEAQPSQSYFDALLAQKEPIEREFGEALTWYSVPHVAAKRVFVARPARLAAEGEWPEQHEWLRQRLERLHDVFAKRVKALASPVGGDAE
ncbi:MAG: DUF4268 domain-containing protein [Planctomycetes bacterium]|nr:DUF4268 domain-containing protein [Planctomycetota bacterium]